MLSVTPGVYEINERSFDIEVGVPYDLSEYDRANGLRGVPTSFVSEDFRMLRLEGKRVIGLASGASHLSVRLEGVDLNGDGKNEYFPREDSVAVNISDKPAIIAKNAWIIALPVSAAVFAAVFVLMIKRRKVSGTETNDTDL